MAFTGMAMASLRSSGIRVPKRQAAYQPMEAVRPLRSVLAEQRREPPARRIFDFGQIGAKRGRWRRHPTNQPSSVCNT